MSPAKLSGCGFESRLKNIHFFHVSKNVSFTSCVEPHHLFFHFSTFCLIFSVGVNQSGEREKLLSIGCGGIENWHCSLMWTSPNEARPLDPNDIHHLDDFLAIQSYPTNPKCSHLLSIKKFLLLKTP